MRAALALAGAIAAATLSAITAAAGPGQTAAVEATDPAEMPSGWRHSVGQGINTYRKGDDPVEIVVLSREVPASTVAEVDAFAARIFSTMGCTGVPPTSSDGVVGPFGSGARCFASFARSLGGYAVAIGAAATPQGATEALDFARRLSAAGGAGTAASTRSDPPASGADVAAVDKALAAALDAVPKRHLPIHMTLRRGFRYTGSSVEPDYTLWMLFADGFATSCTRWDPAKQAPTAEALAALVEETSCRVGRWRPAPGGATFDDEPKADPTSLEDAPPPVRGTTYAGYFDSSRVIFSNMANWNGPKQMLIDSTAMSLAKDGRFRLGTERLEQSSLTPNRTGASLTGRYMIDRYLIAIAVDGRVERHFFHALGKPTDEDILFYFDGSLLRRR